MPRVRPVAKPISLNDEQTEVVATRDGYFQVLAGPGAGKTQAISMRYAALIREGVSPDDILSMSFTRTAATNLRSRVEEQTGKLSINRKLAGASTYHSFALNFILEERSELGVELAEFPLAPEPTANRLAAKAASRFEIDPRTLRTSISLQKRNRVRPSEAIRQAESGGKSSDIKLALAYKEYDKLLRGEGLLDFDGLMVETVDLLCKNAAVRGRNQFLYCMADESQDNSKIEWVLLKLITQKHGNLLCVGDVSQCQPAGTLITVPLKKIKGGYIPLSQIPIEDIKEGKSIQTWHRRESGTRIKGQKVTETSSREYRGILLTIRCNGKETRVTPDHQMWATLSDNCRLQQIVYMMYREGFGFRIGTCRTSIYKGNRNGMGGFAGRCYEEKADMAWVIGA